MKIMGNRSCGPVLKHGPNTASGGNARERAWERPISLPDWQDKHRKVQLAPPGSWFTRRICLLIGSAGRLAKPVAHQISATWRGPPALPSRRESRQGKKVERSG